MSPIRPAQNRRVKGYETLNFTKVTEYNNKIFRLYPMLILKKFAQNMGMSLYLIIHSIPKFRGLFQQITHKIWMMGVCGWACTSRVGWIILIYFKGERVYKKKHKKTCVMCVLFVYNYRYIEIVIFAAPPAICCLETFQNI